MVLYCVPALLEEPYKEDIFMKKFMSFVLCIALVLGMCTMPAMAEEAAYRTLYSGEITSLNYLTTATTN